MIAKDWHGPKQDNRPTAKAAKVEIRRNVLEAVARPVRVFDAFAGTGELYRAIWCEADSYTGCDQRYLPDDRRRLFCADNRRVMRAIDLGAFNVFDLDAYGSPWEQAIILAARRRLEPGERIGLVVTDAGLTYKNNVIPRPVAELTGLRHGVAVGVWKNREALHRQIAAALARRFRGRIERQWMAEGVRGAAVTYWGFVLAGGLDPPRQSH
jgi:hypothetical protein